MRTTYRNQTNLDKSINHDNNSSKRSTSSKSRSHKSTKTTNDLSNNNNNYSPQNVDQMRANNNSKFHDLQLGDSTCDYNNQHETNSIVSARSVSSLILRKLSPERRYDIPIDGKLVIPKLITIDLWSNDPIIILSTLEELGHLCHPDEYNCKQNRQLIHSIGGHLAYSVLMKKWNHRCDIQFRTICAIGVTCMDYDQFCIASIQVGVLESIIIAMKNYYYDEYIQLSGCGTLVVLLNSSSRSMKTTSTTMTDQLRRVISSSSNHIHDDHDYNHNNHNIINTNTSSSHIAHDPKNAEHLVNHLQAHIVVMNAIKTFPNNLHLQGIVCELLLSLCEFEQLKHPIVQAGGLRLLGFIVEANSTTTTTHHHPHPNAIGGGGSGSSNGGGPWNNNAASAAATTTNATTTIFPTTRHSSYDPTEETAVLTLARKAMQHLLEK